MSGRAVRPGPPGRPAGVVGWLPVVLLLALLPVGGSRAWAQEPDEAPSEPSSESSPAVEESEEAEQEAAPEPEPDRIRFEGLIELEDGESGSVRGSADSLQFDGTGRAILEGDVEILYQDIRIRAQRIELDEQTQDVVALGGVIFDQGPSRLAGDTLEFNLETETGRLTGVNGSMGTDYFFVGEEILKVGEDKYRVIGGRFSSCEGEPPVWSFKAKQIDVTVDGYAKVSNATFRAKKTPILWVPYALWPVRDDRTSGFLMPKPGYSSRRGASLGVAYFWAINRSFDTTVNVDLFTGANLEDPLGTGQYLGVGNELRYRPSEGTEGRFEGYAIRDPEEDDVRWRYVYDHASRDLPWGMRGIVHVEDVSDFDYFLDFERRGDQNSRRQLYSTGYLTRNWGPHSAILNFDQRETFFDSSGSTVTLSQLPEFEYQLRPTRLGSTPLYLQMLGGAHLLDMDRSALLDNTYGRLDLFPRLKLPLRTVPWLSLSLTAGGRMTWYGDSLLTAEEKAEDPDRDSDFRGESLTRVSPTAQAEVIGPSFSRIFEGGFGRFEKLKHIVEPRFNYDYLDRYDEAERVPSFDEVDQLTALNTVTYALVNRLLAKPAGDDGGGAFEILSFELAQSYSLDEDQPLQRSSDGTLDSQESPVRALLRYQPSRGTTVRLESRYNTLFSRFQSHALSGSVGFGARTRIGLRYTNRVRPDDGEKLSDQIRLSALFPITRRLTFNGQVNYDLERDFSQMQRYFLKWRGSCYELDLEYGDYDLGGRQDQVYRLTFSLKNVGKFLDISGGDSEDL